MTPDYITVIQMIENTDKFKVKFHYQTSHVFEKRTVTSVQLDSLKAAGVSVIGSYEEGA